MPVAHEVFPAACPSRVVLDHVTSKWGILAGRPRLLIVLSQVRDPGNAGTVLRGADAFGADAVIVTASSVDIHAPKVVRSTAGSMFHVPVVTGMAIEDVLRHLREARIRTLAADGFVHRDAQPVIPPRVDYSLTPRGDELVAHLLPLFGWVVAHADEIVAQRG